MKTGNSRKIIGTALCLCAAAIVGCNDESDFEGITGTTSGIGFEVTLKGGEGAVAQTRSTLGTTAFEGGTFDSGNLCLRTTVTENKENPFTAAKSRATTLTVSSLSTFSVYAYAYSSEESWNNSPETNLYIEEGTVTQNGSLWAFDPARYWPSTDYRLAFFAYAPTSLGDVADGSLEVSLDVTSNLPQIAYTVPSSYDEQKDLVVATVTDQTKSESSVSLEFNHILTAVQLKCGSVPEGTISSISFSGIQGQGTYDLAKGSWTLESETTTYEIEGTFTATDNTKILTGNYTLMLLPQRLGEDAAITVTYTPDGGEEKTLKANLRQTDLTDNEQEWEPGKIVTYIFSQEE
ncbi:MAG: fimbrillin family protein [Porphyromonadaceae bacterium]|nr:fimbrillin family protein [Porphyromonadaceae bacterium]